MTDSSWFVYIIEAENGNLYTGITTDVERRFEEHRSGQKGAKFFKTTRPKRIVHTETFSSRGEALKREAAIKKLSRPQKLKLIAE